MFERTQLESELVTLGLEGPREHFFPLGDAVKLAMAVTRAAADLQRAYIGLCRLAGASEAMTQRLKRLRSAPLAAPALAAYRTILRALTTARATALTEYKTRLAALDTKPGAGSGTGLAPDLLAAIKGAPRATLTLVEPYITVSARALDRAISDAHRARIVAYFTRLASTQPSSSKLPQWLDAIAGATGGTRAQVQQFLKAWEVATTAQRDGLLAQVFSGARVATTDSIHLTEDDRWSLYFLATLRCESGTPVSLEHMLLPLLDLRNACVTNPSGIGMTGATRVDTYHSHGWGQYDVNANHGVDVTVRAPAKLDLSALMSSGTHHYDYVDTEVLSLSAPGPREPDREALRKLQYGFFGRGVSSAKATALAQQGFDVAFAHKRSPEGGRVLGGLLFRNTVTQGSFLLGPDLERLRDELKALLAADPLVQAIWVDRTQPFIPDSIDVTTNVNFGSHLFVNRAAVGSTRKQRGAARKVLLAAVARYLKLDNPLSRGVLDLINAHADAVAGTAKSKLDWSGPVVQVSHHYRRVTPSRDLAPDAWVTYTVRHLSEVSVSRGGRNPATLGKVGGTGNSISPHAHMFLQLFFVKPKANLGVEDTTFYDFINPLDFFGMLPTPWLIRP